MTSAPQVVIVGAGQLGSRYLQGLAGLAMPSAITVIDQSIESLARARKRWAEVEGPATSHSVHWSTDLDDVGTSIDLAIVATPADLRADVVAALASARGVRYWVLEKVLAQKSADIDSLKISTDSAEGVWVNTPRRMIRWHQSLRQAVSARVPLQVLKGSGPWGLACNSIHFIDLVAWWSGERLVAVDTSEIDSHWLPSKRPGYFEVTGVLKARFSGGSTLHLEAREGGVDRGLTVATRDGMWRIDETTGIATDPQGANLEGTLEFQSALTPRLVASILDIGRCDLPTLDESAQMHRVFLDAMLAHWNRSHDRNDTRVPIT